MKRTAWVMFQNSNLSVRCTDAFLSASVTDGDWTTRSVTTGRPMDTSGSARTLMDKIAEGTWLCGDPGVQYEDTIQRWHTCPNTAPINSSNPCSEYMFIDDSACNLASINLMKFRREDGSFDAERFRAAVRLFITLQEILVDHASYPTDQIPPTVTNFDRSVSVMPTWEAFSWPQGCLMTRRKAGRSRRPSQRSCMGRRT